MKDNHCYRTGETAPRKSHQGLITFLLIVVIVLCGIISILSMLNIRLFRMLEQQNPTSAVFSRTASSVTEGEQGVFSASIGACGQNISELYRSYHAWPEGVYISRVEPGSPAERSDLRPGDILMTVNQLPVPDEAAFSAAVGDLTAGEPASVTVYREHQTLTLTLFTSEP